MWSVASGGSTSKTASSPDPRGWRDVPVVAGDERRTEQQAGRANQDRGFCGDAPVQEAAHPSTGNPGGIESDERAERGDANALPEHQPQDRLRGVAPRATRVPISRMRCLTEDHMTP